MKSTIYKAVVARQLGAGGAIVEMPRHYPLHCETQPSRRIVVKKKLKPPTR